MRGFLAGLLLAVLFLGGGAILFLYQDYKSFLVRPLALSQEHQILHIEPGSALRQVADTLVAQRLLDRPAEYFVALARMEGLSQRIQAGEYRLKSGQTPVDLLNLLASGRVVQHAFTIVEGWTFVQLRQALQFDAVLEHTLADLDDSEVMASIGFPGEHPEGRFLPDTYHFPRGTTDVAFLRRAYLAMQEVLAQAWEQRSPDLPLDDPYQALILASIVERESGQASERARIAGVFIRRLRKGMKLQTDPTVIYGLGPSFDGNLRRRDLRNDTPYNTYTRRGLPPTPIALPGVDSINAALHPETGDELYFVAKGDGSHHFSATLSEHNRAVRKFQLGQ